MEIILTRGDLASRYLSDLELGYIDPEDITRGCFKGILAGYIYTEYPVYFLDGKNKYKLD